MGVANDSPLRNPKQTPFPKPPPPVQQNPTSAKQEEDTPSMRELVDEIDSHVALVDLKITSNPIVVLDLVPSQFPDSTTLPTVDTALTQPAMGATSAQPDDPTA